MTEKKQEKGGACGDSESSSKLYISTVDSYSEAGEPGNSKHATVEDLSLLNVCNI